MRVNSAAMCLLTAILVAGCASDEQDPLSSFSKKKRTPFVPAQAQTAVTAWTPPENQLPRDFVEAVAFLQSHGLPDPRGGAFVKAKLIPPPVTNGMFRAFPGQQQAEVYGWKVNSGGQDSVISIDGIRHTDVISTSPATVADLLKDNRPGIQGGFQNYYGGAPTNPRAMFAALLLITGDTKGAETALGTQAQVYGLNPFVNLANIFLAGEWERACTAFQHGDDQGAYNLGSALAKLRPAYEKEAFSVLGSQGVKNLQHPQFYPNGEVTSSTSVFPMLDQASTLASDAARRLQHPKTARTPLNSDNVQSLIASLEDYGYVAGGGVPISPHIVSPDSMLGLLQREGDKAVEPLLDCAEHDKRLSRSVTPTGYGPQINSVSSLATQTLLQITRLSPGVPSQNVPTDLAAIRKWWLANKSFTPEQRMFRLLADDKATPQEWQNAAQTLVHPEQSVMQMGVMNPPKHDDSWLRAQKSPSLTELLSKRTLQVLPGKIQPNQGMPPGFSSAEAMATDLAEWDPKGSLATIRTVTDRFEQLIDATPGMAQNYVMGDRQIMNLLEVRINHGDQEAAKPYRRLLISASTNGGYVDSKVFQFLYQHRFDASFKGVLAALFLDPLLHPNRPDPNSRFQYVGNSQPLVLSVVSSPLLSTPEVRAALTYLLKDKTQIGTVRNDGRRITIDMGPGRGVTMMESPNDGLEPTAGQSWPFRRCDTVFQSVTRLKGAPTFQQYWPVDLKDKAIKQLLDLIDTHKHDELALLQWPDDWKATPAMQVPSAGGSTGFTVPTAVPPAGSRITNR